MDGAATPPPGRHVDVELRDGSTVRVRPVRPGDVDALARFLEQLAPEDLHHRFFGTVDPADAARAMAAADGRDRHGIVALHGAPARVVGHAEYVRAHGEQVAEAAFTVAGALQHRGLGTVLLAHLAERASAMGVREFEAVVMRGNRAMVDMFRASGFPVEVRHEDGEHLVRIPTALTAGAIAAFEARERVAAAAAVSRLLAPRSVAVVGASRRRGTVGGEVLHNLVAGGYVGRVYAVNSSATEVQGLPAHRDVASLPEAVDLAVIAVPAAAVAAVARQAGTRGVRTLVVLSAGFAEVGPEGAARQDELLEICRASGMRMIGPNCLGVLSTDPAVRMDATFALAMPPPGGVAMLSQSGGLGIALADGARELGIGLSAFVSVGNKADISGNDLLAHWRDDPATRVVVLYLESFGNPRRFARIAPEVTREKPVIAMKGGRGRAGARAAASHTGALVSASDAAVDALFHQAGVIRARTLSELFDVTRLLAAQPAPAGPRVGIVTNAGGPGILCADACEEHGLEVTELPGPVRDDLARIAPAEAGLSNPVDLLAAGTPDQFDAAVTALAGARVVDALIVIYIEPGLGGHGPQVAEAVRRAARRPDAPPTALVLMSSEDRDAAAGAGRDGDPPVFAHPEAAARALGHAMRWEARRRLPRGTVPRHADADPGAAGAVLARAAAAGPAWLAPDDLSALMRAYGLPLIATHRAADARAAGAAAAGIDGAVALKAVAPGLVHKSDVGAVHLGLTGREQVERAARDMAARLSAHGAEPEAFLVQPMAPAGVEVLVGSATDAQFGPVVACGAGGTEAELRADLAVRLTPLTDADAAEMVRGLRMFPLLTGYRGAPPCDIGSLEDVLLRVAAMVHAHPQIAELDCNPVSVSPAGAVIVDARVRVAPAPDPVPWPSWRATPPGA